MTKRPGYYVNGKFFAFRFAQALAHAQHCSTTFGRLVDVDQIGHDGRATNIRSVAAPRSLRAA